jgi:hypothetical protein
MELFQAWVHISYGVMNTITPTALSVAEVHHFVNHRPETPPPDPRLETDDELDGDGDDEWDEVDRIPDGEILNRALSIEPTKKRGRRRRATAMDEDEDEDEDEEGERGRRENNRLAHGIIYLYTTLTMVPAILHHTTSCANATRDATSCIIET